jgi:hypothetical protein
MSNKDAKVEECRHYLANYYCFDEMFTNLIQINACGLTKEGYHEFHYKKCKDNPNCYFKQLQRKEEENNRLREALEKITQECNNGQCTIKNANNDYDRSIYGLGYLQQIKDYIYLVSK